MIPLRILIVDDEAIVRELLETILTNNGHETVAAQSGAEGVRYLLFDRFDLVITDLQLGDTSGMEIIRKVKELDETTIVFLMTGCRDALCRVKALQMGADAFLAKPFDLDEMISLIQFHSVKYLAAGKLRMHFPRNDLAVSE
ncbi:response regulator [Desulfofustis glycolicus]|uniref:Response regulator receiver domain-containing protein n=1 Tax=Desulfofustis glycolicus DSM 9705 TaxID=1121409 RepID=A0A1M5X9S2_9BACT|nr:response regulator [Desulfofustis glycolicus]MCB2218173.1 response regulator [Desulfobulbaceae bacterium]SHH96597.1 Response regulator receiver domain-containing protein [Desulfofustis glycolicus DSM 9705]